MSQELTQEQAIDQLEPMTIEEVRSLMESSQTEAEWNANCDKVKRQCDGYPAFWFAEIVQSGVTGRVAARFGKDDRIHIHTIATE